MGAKDFLNRGFRIEQRIKSKLEIIAELRALPANITSTISDMPRNPPPNNDAVTDILFKIQELEAEVNGYITELIDVKKELLQLLHKIKNPDFSFLLELRYLRYKTWEEIGEEMHYSERQVYLLHIKALSCFNKMLRGHKKSLQ